MFSSRLRINWSSCLLYVLAWSTGLFHCYCSDLPTTSACLLGWSLTLQGQLISTLTLARFFQSFTRLLMDILAVLPQYRLDDLCLQTFIEYLHTHQVQNIR